MLMTRFIHTGDINDIEGLMRRGKESTNKVQLHFYKKGLMLNVNKTQCMFIGTKRLLSQIPPYTHIHVNWNQIVPCKSLKNLGIHFDNHLQCDAHINELSRKYTEQVHRLQNFAAKVV